MVIGLCKTSGAGISYSPSINTVINSRYLWSCYACVLYVEGCGHEGSAISWVDYTKRLVHVVYVLDHTPQTR